MKPEEPAGGLEEQLAMVECHIARAGQLVATQSANVERLRAGGHDASASVAERLLRAFEATLEEHRTHRASLLRRIAMDDC